MTQKQPERLGPEGLCICPKCGEKTAHRRGVPCQDEQCPKCGAKMLREGSEHHRLFEERQAKQEKKRQKDAQSNEE
jgi:Zn-finger nucleic acid-binding protein